MATTTLGSKATGSIIKLKENGKLVEFYVGVHNYESGLNGTGRTLVFRKDCYDQRQWHGSNVNAYASSAIDSWLNSTYKNMLDADIRALIGSTKIRYTPGNGNNAMSTLDRAVFLLSAYELGKSESWFNKEGTTLPNATNYQIAKLNGSAVVQWTRSPLTSNANYAICLNSNGDVHNHYCTGTYGSRPAFTLPSNLYVSDDGSVFKNTAPSVPASITIPSAINGGTDITVSWAKSTDAENNLAGYIVERSTNGGSSWSQIYQGSATSTQNNVPFGTASVQYRVKAYDTEGLESGWRTGNVVNVINNRAPNPPGSISVPAVIRGGSTTAISWGAATDTDNNLAGYELERSVNGGAWTQIYKGAAVSYTDTITAGWNTVAYRVRAYDNYNATSTYVTSDTRTVDNNSYPTITSATASGTDLGLKNTGFDFTYTVADADKDTVTVKEYLDGTVVRTYQATLGASNTFEAVTAANFHKVLNGDHTLKVVANDGKADSAAYTVRFSKKVTSASVTLEKPLDADDAITIMVLNIVGSIPVGADLEVLVTNNAKDPEPVWEDATADIKAGANHVFTNKTAANGFAFNFKLSVSRGSNDLGGYITNIGGAFQ